MNAKTPQQTHSNGRRFVNDETRRPPNRPESEKADAANELPLLNAAKDLIVERLGTCLIAGIVVGGVLGWLTSKLK